MSVQEALERATKIALEDWAMMISEQVIPEQSGEEFHPIQEQDVLMHAKMPYASHDGKHGEINICCGKGFADTLARNLLGMDFSDEVSLADALDSLCEMTNVLGGHFATEEFGVDTVIELRSPEAKIIEDQTVFEAAQKNGYVMMLGDDEPALFFIQQS
jgi:hypothetical protein